MVDLCGSVSSIQMHSRTLLGLTLMNMRKGPNALSINSSSANNMIYSAANYMDKSESYVKPGHVGDVSLFFKNERKDSARRKRIWANAFTGTAYAYSVLTLYCTDIALLCRKPVNTTRISYDADFSNAT